MNDDDVDNADDTIYEVETNVFEEPTDAERELATSVGVFVLRRPWQAADWSCSLCKYHCLAAETRCTNPANPQCVGVPPPPRRQYGNDANGGGGQRARETPRIGNEWICRFPHCGAMNFGSRDKCFACKIPRDPQSIGRDELRELVRKFRDGRRREQLARPVAWSASNNGRRQSTLEASSTLRQQPYGQ